MCTILMLILVADTYKETILIITKIILNLTNSESKIYPVEGSMLKALMTLFT
jgi:hypothetical protein